MKTLIILAFTILPFFGITQTLEVKPIKITTGCLLIEEAFEKKNGVSTGHMELYIRCSVQDYFIKFCESEVTSEDVAKYVGQSVEVTYEIRAGNWDICKTDPQEMQSRIGNYAVVYSMKGN